MVSDTVKAQKKRTLDIELLIRFDKERTLFMMLDDGKCVELDEDDENKAIRDEKCSYLKSVTKSVSYQYVLDMNRTVLVF